MRQYPRDLYIHIIATYSESAKNAGVFSKISRLSPWMLCYSSESYFVMLRTCKTSENSEKVIPSYFCLFLVY